MSNNNKKGQGHAPATDVSEIIQDREEGRAANATLRKEDSNGEVMQ